jgi:hypothetical protein
MDIEQGQPVLQGLQTEAQEDEPDSEGAEASLGKMVGVVLDVWGHRDASAGDDARNQPQAYREGPRVLEMAHKRTAN